MNPIALYVPVWPCDGGPAYSVSVAGQHAFRDEMRDHHPDDPAEKGSEQGGEQRLTLEHCPKSPASVLNQRRNH